MSDDTREQQASREALPVRGLWFLAYIAPWMIVVSGIVDAMRGDNVNVVVVHAVVSAVIALPLWYGVSRRTTWGFFYVVTLFTVEATVALFTGEPVPILGSLLALVLWGIYLAKRWPLFQSDSKPAKPADPALEERLARYRQEQAEQDRLEELRRQAKREKGA